VTEAKTQRPATAQDIRSIIGELEDGVVASILRTGATREEVLEAFTWATADDFLGSELERSRRGAVGAVYDILRAEDEDPEEI
jgi:hypothetical protein